VGVYLRANPDLYEKSLKISWVMYPFVAVASFFKQYAFVAGVGLSLFSIPIHLVCAYFGTMFLLIVCKKIDHCDWLEFWGKNSLVVYALILYHYYFLQTYYGKRLVLRPQSYLLAIS
jgi:hypothetical protein